MTVALTYLPVYPPVSLTATDVVVIVVVVVVAAAAAGTDDGTC